MCFTFTRLFHESKYLAFVWKITAATIQCKMWRMLRCYGRVIECYCKIESFDFFYPFIYIPKMGFHIDKPGKSRENIADVIEFDEFPIEL